MDSLATVLSLIDAVGVSALARALGHRNVTTVSSWKLRGVIPSGHWSQVIEAARAAGVEGVTLEALAAAHDGKVRAPTRRRTAGAAA